MAPLRPTIRYAYRSQAERRSTFRKLIRRVLNNAGVPAHDHNPDLRSLANTFSRYAQTQQTAYESGVAATSNGTTSVMERTVEYAIAQVLGRAPGSDGGLGNALNDAFPMLPGGQIAASPVRGIVSMNGNGPAAMGSSDAAGLSGQISAEQATLYRLASLVVPDARKVLAAITPFATVNQPDTIESLRAVIDQAFATLLDEFARVDQPRPELVDDYLRNARTTLAQFGPIARVDGSTTPDVFSDEQQIASYKLVIAYLNQLSTAWKAYIGRNENASEAYPLFTERLARASQMLGVIAQANVNFMAAMDSVGFPETERRSSASRFEYLDTKVSPPEAVGIGTLAKHIAGTLTYSTMTVYDYTSWVEKLARYDGPRYLADSGQVGLEFVTAQADKLFCTIAPVLLFALASADQSLLTRPIVAQVLAHERVKWAMSDLFSQLDVLADQAR